MKTNHRRNFVAKDDTLDNRIKHITKKDSYLGLLFHATSGGALPMLWITWIS